LLVNFHCTSWASQSTTGVRGHRFFHSSQTPWGS
jgi:hypothetical protein